MLDFFRSPYLFMDVIQFFSYFHVIMPLPVAIMESSYNGYYKMLLIIWLLLLILFFTLLKVKIMTPARYRFNIYEGNWVNPLVLLEAKPVYMGYHEGQGLTIRIQPENDVGDKICHEINHKKENTSLTLLVTEDFAEPLMVLSITYNAEFQSEHELLCWLYLTTLCFGLSSVFDYIFQKLCHVVIMRKFSCEE